MVERSASMRGKAGEPMGCHCRMNELFLQSDLDEPAAVLFTPAPTHGK